MKRVWLSIGLVFVCCAGSFRHSYVLQPPSAPTIALSDSAEIRWKMKLKAYPNNCIALNDTILLISDSNGGVTTIDLRTGVRHDRYWRPFKRPVRLLGFKGNIVFLSSCETKEVIAWDLKNAHKIWKKTFAEYFSEMVLHQTALYFKSDSIIAKVNALNGNVILSQNLHEPLARGFIYFNDHLFVFAAKGILHSFDLNLEEKNRSMLEIHHAEEMVQFGERLLFYNTRGNVRVFSLQSKAVCALDFDDPIYASPLIVDDHVFVPFARGRIDARSLENDSLIWRFSHKSLLNIAPLLIKENIIIPFARGQVVVINLHDGRERQRFNFDKSIDFAALTPRGLLLGHRRELYLVSF